MRPHWTPKVVCVGTLGHELVRWSRQGTSFWWRCLSAWVGATSTFKAALETTTPRVFGTIVVLNQCSRWIFVSRVWLQEKRLDLINTLNEVTEGKIFVEVGLELWNWTQSFEPTKSLFIWGWCWFIYGKFMMLMCLADLTAWGSWKILVQHQYLHFKRGGFPYRLAQVEKARLTQMLVVDLVNAMILLSDHWLWDPVLAWLSKDELGSTPLDTNW